MSNSKGADGLWTGPRQTPRPAAPLPTNGSAIVVGASLAGLMASLALARAGLRVTLVERGSAQPRSGVVLQVDSGDVDQSATAQALRQLASGGLQSAEAWSSIEARLSAEVQATAAIDRRYATRIESMGQDADAAWVVTEMGETLRADLVIGADGYRSTIRRFVNPDQPEATFAGYLIWVGIVDELDIPARYRPGPNPAVAMPNGIGDFLLGSVIAGRDGSRTVGQRRLGWAWYDNTRNDLLRRTGCVRGSVVQHSLTGAAIPAQTIKELTKQAAARWPPRNTVSRPAS